MFSTAFLNTWYYGSWRVVQDHHHHIALFVGELYLWMRYHFVLYEMNYNMVHLIQFPQYYWFSKILSHIINLEYALWMSYNLVPQVSVMKLWLVKDTITKKSQAQFQ